MITIESRYLREELYELEDYLGCNMDLEAEADLREQIASLERRIEELENATEDG